MKIKTVIEVVELLAQAAHAQAADLRRRTRQAHELDAAARWEEIGGILDAALAQLQRRETDS